MNEITLHIYDDGKGKDQSWEASSDQFPERGYGSTKRAALEDYRRILSQKMQVIGTLMDAIRNNKAVQVDWLGDPVPQTHKP